MRTKFLKQTVFNIDYSQFGDDMLFTTLVNLNKLTQGVN